MHQKSIRIGCQGILDKSKKRKNLYFLWQTVLQNCQEERQRIPGIHSKTGVSLSEDVHVEAEEPQPTESRDDIEARRDFWSKETSSIVITLNREFNFMCPRKKHFLFHWNTLMSWGQHIQIWTQHKRNALTIIGLWMKIKKCQIREQDHEVYPVERNTSKRIHVVWRETDKNSNNNSTRSYLARSVVQDWESRSKETQEWAIEKTKLENARNLKGIYSINSDDEEYKDIIKNASRKLERRMAASVPCMRKPGSTRSRETGESIWEHSKDKIQLYCGNAWIHKAKNWIWDAEKVWRSYCKQKRTKFNIALQRGA